MFTLSFLAIAGLSSAAVCDTLYDKYVGFPECHDRMAWVKANWQTDAKFAKGGVDGTYCSIQRYLWNEKDAQGNPAHYCPDPDWVDTSSMTKTNADGSQTFLVFRAANTDPKDPFATKLLNSNAANLGGVLGYVHTEVVPEDMRNAGGTEVAACTRKFGIDAILVFNVTVKTPKAYQDKFGNMLGPFTAFDRGVCTGGTQVCDFENYLGAYAPGRQMQDGNPRHAYPTAQWYSFPECGFCDWPDGTKYCTYTYNVVGRLFLDDIVMISSMTNLPISDPTIGHPTFYDYCKTGKKEYERNVPVIVGSNDCTHGTYPNTISGLDFWYYPCEARMCKDRMQRVVATQAKQTDTSIAQPGGGPAMSRCPAAKWGLDSSSSSSSSTGMDSSSDHHSSSSGSWSSSSSSSSYMPPSSSTGPGPQPQSWHFDFTMTLKMAEGHKFNATLNYIDLAERVEVPMHQIKYSSSVSQDGSTVQITGSVFNFTNKADAEKAYKLFQSLDGNEMDNGILVQALHVNALTPEIDEGPTGKPHDKGNGAAVTVGIILAVLFVAVIAVGIYLFYRAKKEKSQWMNMEEDPHGNYRAPEDPAHAPATKNLQVQEEY